MFINSAASIALYRPPLSLPRFDLAQNLFGMKPLDFLFRRRPRRFLPALDLLSVLPPLLLLLLIDLVLLSEDLGVDLNAPARDVDEDSQVVDDVPETEEVVAVLVAERHIVELGEEALDAVVLDEEGLDHLLLGELVEDLNEVGGRDLVKHR